MKGLTAGKADRYDLYRLSVQAVEQDVGWLCRVFRREAGRPLRVFREDFCGTAQLLCHFVQQHPENLGIGIDRDPEPLDWCRRKSFPLCTAAQQKRIHLIEKDVLLVRTSPVDAIAAFNFSYCTLKTRSELRRYFQNVRRSLKNDGMFVVDASGGSEVTIEGSDTWNMGDFSYEWEVASFDPVTHHIVCKIHFLFPDGTRKQNAFVYHWRLWTLPELRELLAEAGFQRVEVFWESTDRKTNQGNGVMRRVRKGRVEGAWYAILAARKCGC